MRSGDNDRPEEGCTMDHDREHDSNEADATSVTGPTGTPPDEGKAYDPEMTDTDEANIPPESDADPEAA
jgi:hypothetical protein